MAAVVLVWAVAGRAGVAAVADGSPAVVNVSSYEQLLAALQTGPAARRIVVTRGEYLVDRPLVVPDGVTLEGEGVMRVGADGMPEGFEPGSESTLRVATGFHGQLLTLGDGSAVRGLRLVDLENPAAQPDLRRGNVVYVASRAPRDSVVATIVECELETRVGAGFSEAGPHGHAIAALTLNPNLGAAPAPHEDARVRIDVRRSIVRSRSGAVVFLINFAARGNVAAQLEGNRFEGYLTAGAGVSRPDLVSDAVTSIQTRDNRYGAWGLDRHGWLLIGGGTPAHFLDAGIPGAARNTLRVESTGDRIEGFRVGIQAAAARRLGPESSPLTDNVVDLHMVGTSIRTTGENAADLVLNGTLSEVAQAQGPGEFPAGDRNVLRVSLAGVSGSGAGRNRYLDVAGPVLPENQGAGNRLEFAGDRAGFLQSNRGLLPPPDARFFDGDR
jgi:hypothetical protein